MRRMPTNKDFEILEEQIEALPHRYMANNIEAGGEWLDKVKAGDIVVKHTGQERHAYMVTYWRSDEILLVYCDHQNVEGLYFEKHEGVWSLVAKDITHIGG